MFEFFSTIFNTFLYEPILNFLIILYNLLGNFGLAVIMLTIIIKILTNPLNKKSLESQKMMTEMQPKIKELQKKYPDREQQSRELIKLYQETKFNPFSGIFLLFLQIPIFFALFRIFQSEITISKISSLIYPFVPLPETINYFFLGVNLSQSNIYIALITAVAQYFQLKTATPPTIKTEEKGQVEEMTQIMQKQMTYFIPVVTFVVLFKLPAALGLYWSITTILNTIQQRKIFKKDK
jgi:YidC/Oxa1 family membrane protein insertase